MILKNLIVLVVFSLLFSCNENDNVVIKIYKNDEINNFSGCFYTTKYGGLNFYVSDSNNRDDFFKSKEVDSVLILVDNKQYTAKPLIRKGFSRDRNDSDFSFNISESELKIIPDTIEGKATLQFFSERTDMEKLKNEEIIKAKFIHIKN